jgi:hypothetical protein
MGLFRAAGHSPNRLALATRKVCQNDEFRAGFAAVDKARTGPYLCENRVSRDGAFGLRFWPMNLRFAEFPLIWRSCRIGPVPRCVTMS